MTRLHGDYRNSCMHEVTIKSILNKNEPEYEKVNEIFDYYKREYGITPSYIAKHSHIGRATISDWQQPSHSNRKPTVENLYIIANVLYFNEQTTKAIIYCYYPKIQRNNEAIERRTREQIDR